MSLCWCVNERTHRRDEPCPERAYWLEVEDSEQPPLRRVPGGMLGTMTDPYGRDFR